MSPKKQPKDPPPDAVDSRRPTRYLACRPCRKVFVCWKAGGKVKCPQCGLSLTIATDSDKSAFPKADFRAVEDTARAPGYTKADK